MVDNYKSKINYIPEEGSAVFGFIKAHVNDEFIDIKKQSEEQQKIMQIKKDYELALKLQNEENNNRRNNNNIINVNNNNNININNNNINANNNNININNNYFNHKRINTARNIQRNNNYYYPNRNTILNNVNKNKISKNTNFNTLTRNRTNLRINMEDISNLKNNTMRDNAKNNINNYNDFCLLTYNENDFKRDKSPNFFEEKKTIKVNKNIDLKKKSNNIYNMDYCVICLGNFKKGDKLRKLSCFHIFHIKCINDWFKKKKSCPIDNKENLKFNEIIYKF